MIGKATLQGRRLRLHRFYAIQAYHGRKVFEESKRIVVESAADVLACLAQLQNSSAPMWSQRGSPLNYSAPCDDRVVQASCLDI